MKYLTLAVPAELAHVANSIALVFEPDPSVSPDTYNSFSTLCVGIKVLPTEDNQSPIQYSIPNEEYCCYGTEVREWIADSTDAWVTNPEQLYEFVIDTYNERWLGHVTPTLEECKEFCQKVLISKQYGILSGISELGLQIGKKENGN